MNNLLSLKKNLLIAVLLDLTLLLVVLKLLIDEVSLAKLSVRRFLRALTLMKSKGKKERIKSITLKAKKESSDDETSRSISDDEEYAMALRNFKKFFRRKVDGDVGEEEAIRKNTKVVNTNNEEDEPIEVEEIVNIKESKNHPLFMS
ncbi:hypothetical protein Tco_1102293 [Tanacetum coccineum]